MLTERLMELEFPHCDSREMVEIVAHHCVCSWCAKSWRVIPVAGTAAGHSDPAERDRRSPASDISGNPMEGGALGP